MTAIAPVTTQPDLACLFSQASYVVTTELTAGLASLGVSSREYCVLAHALGNELTQIRLADLCQLDKTTMVVTVDNLESAGLAERRPSSTDRRARIIAVTAAGARVVAEAQRIVDAIYENVLSSLPTRQRDIFVAALTTLVDTRLSTPMRCEKAPRRRTP
jgi:MarR family transcriptional regulator for hemolysin